MMGAYDGDIQMIDGTSRRVHHSAAALKKAAQIKSLYGPKSRRTDDEYACRVGCQGPPDPFSITPDRDHEASAAAALWIDLQDGQIILGDKVYDTDCIRRQIED